MDNTGDEADAMLSDVEEDDLPPITISNPSQEDVFVKRIQELLSELKQERAAREATERTMSELQVSFSRLKSLAHEAIKKRDEAMHEKENSIAEKEKISRDLTEAMKLKDEMAVRLGDAVKDRETLESEVENSRHMLVSGIEKISGKVSSVKNFSSMGLPRSQKYNGFPAIAYGVIKRTNEIVDELLKHADLTEKSRNEVREQMEQRNYEIAIEVSQLEATISGLRDDVAKKTSVIENLQKHAGEKEGRILEMEKEMLEKMSLLEKETMMMRRSIDDREDKLRNLELKMESQSLLFVEQLNFVGKIHTRLYNVIKIVDVNHQDSEVSESLFLPQKSSSDENILASLAGLESIYELSKIIFDKTRCLLEEENNESKRLREQVSQLVKEKELVGSSLRNALSRKMTSDPSLDLDGDEIYAMAVSAQNVISSSQFEITQLQCCLEELRAESNLFKEKLEAQSKELSNRIYRIEELEEKMKAANESAERLLSEVAVAEEEIVRWKVAAEQEAAAGKAVEEETLSQLWALRQEFEEARQSLLESEKKLKFKEETAAAAMAAREAAEKSLGLADVKASRLRDRIEKLSQQLEAFETQYDSRSRHGRYVCWPWQWLGFDFVGTLNPRPHRHHSNEMELSEPLM